MVESIIAFFAGLPAPLATTILSALPIVELRLTIPVAIHEWSMTPGLAFGCGVVGALLPFLPLYFGLMKLRGWCERNKIRGQEIVRANGDNFALRKCCPRNVL